MKIGECDECVARSWDLKLREACASVAMSRGKTANQMMISYLRRYHTVGHDEARMDQPDE